MASNGFARKVLAVEMAGLALLGGAAFFLARSQDEPAPSGPQPQAQQKPKPAAFQSQSPEQITKEYDRSARPVSDLAGELKSLGAVDLITFVIDTSGSMQDDRQSLRDSIETVIRSNRGRQFDVINYTGTPVITGEPTRDLAELRRRIEAGQDPGGAGENSLLALKTAAERSRSRFKNPLIVLMTDAAPNDGNNAQSQVTVDEAADAINAASGQLYIWAAFDWQEYLSGGAASTSDLYRDLASRIKAGGKIHLVKRNTFDPNWFRQLLR